MKFKKIIMAVVLSMSLFACSNEGIPGTEGSNEVNTFINLSIVNGVSSRTQGTDTQDGIETAENKVSNLYIALVNTATNEVRHYEPTKLETVTDGLSTGVFPMPIGTYKIFVVVNPTDAVKTMMANITNYASLQVAMSDISTYATADHFMMTNAVDFSGDVTNIPTVTVTSANINGNPAKPANAIKLDRMAVKIRMYSDMTATGKTYNLNGGSVVLKKYVGGAWTTVNYNTILIKGYTLLNTYNKANLYQKWDGTSAIYAQQLLTPNHTTDFVAADYSNGMDTYSTRTKDASTVGYSALVDLTAGKNLTALTDVTYCLENNPKPQELNAVTTNPIVGWTKKKEAVTGVLFRAQVVNSSNSGVTFYSYNGKFYADLASIKAEYPLAFGSDAIATVEAKTPEQIRVAYGVKVYVDGNMYYSFYVYDLNYTDNSVTTTNKYYYAIMRNKIYDMNVTGIKKIGTDIPGGWDYNGDDNIDDKDAYMQVELKVNPWILDTYTETFK